MPVVPKVQRAEVVQGIPNVRQRIEAPAAAFGAGTGQSLANLGESFLRTGQLYAEHEAALQEQADLAAVREADNRIASAIRELKDDPESGYLATRGRNAHDGIKAYQEQLQQLAAQADRDWLTNTAQRNLLAPVLKRRIGAALDAGLRHARTELETFTAEAHVARMDTSLRDAVQSWRDGPGQIRARNTAIDEAEQFAAAQGWSNEKLAGYVRAFDQRLAGATVEQMIHEGELGRALRYFEQVRNGLEPDDEVKLSRVLTAAHEERDRRRQSALAEQEKAIKAEHARLTSDLEIAVSRGDAGLIEIERGYAGGDGFLTPAKRTQLVKMADAVVAKQDEQVEQLTRVNNALHYGVPLDPKNADDTKAVDTWYQIQATGWQQLPKAAQFSRVADFVGQTGILPGPVEAFIRVQSRGENPQLAADAADLFDRIRDRAPQAVEQLSPSERSFAALVADTVDAGMDPGQAVELARQRIYETPATEREVIAERLQLGEAETQTGNVESLTALVDENFDPYFRRQPTIPAALQGEYDQLVEAYAFRTQDLATARKLAGDDVRRVWGVTSLNGEQLQLMKYAPEAIFGRGLDSSDWMREQLHGEVEQLGVTPDSVQLVADSLTARNPRSGYQVMQRSEDGLLRPLLGDDNQPLRWVPDFKASPQAARQAAEIEDTLAAAKDQREQYLQRQQLKHGRRNASPGVN